MAAWFKQVNNSNLPDKIKDEVWKQCLPSIYPTVASFLGGSGLPNSKVAIGQCSNCGVLGHKIGDCLEPKIINSPHWTLEKKLYRQKDNGAENKRTLDRRVLRNQLRDDGKTISYDLLLHFVGKSMDKLIDFESTCLNPTSVMKNFGMELLDTNSSEELNLESLKNILSPSLIVENLTADLDNMTLNISDLQYIMEEISPKAYAIEAARSALRALLDDILNVLNVASGFVHYIPQLDKLNYVDADILNGKCGDLMEKRDQLVNNTRKLFKLMGN